MYFVQGGAFASNSNANFNGSDLAREGNMIVVSLNYRVGPYGFLWGEEVEEGVGKGNAGIRDVVMGLEWVRDHITDVSQLHPHPDIQKGICKVVLTKCTVWRQPLPRSLKRRLRRRCSTRNPHRRPSHAARQSLHRRDHGIRNPDCVLSHTGTGTDWI